AVQQHPGEHRVAPCAHIPRPGGAHRQRERGEYHDAAGVAEGEEGERVGPARNDARGDEARRPDEDEEPGEKVDHGASLTRAAIVTCCATPRRSWHHAAAPCSGTTQKPIEESP